MATWKPHYLCGISIHALLAESDLSISKTVRRIWHFYPRSPCGERLLHPVSILINRAFLSTLSLRRATSIGTLRTVKVRNFYPRSPCGERPANCQQRNHQLYFYPRSPCGERHSKIDYYLQPTNNFYPRSPCGERLGFCDLEPIRNPISIHALLAESDLTILVLVCVSIVFLSTLSLRRATYLTNYHFTLLFIFLSTLSLRRATTVC